MGKTSQKKKKKVSRNFSFRKKKKIENQEFSSVAQHMPRKVIGRSSVQFLLKKKKKKTPEKGKLAQKLEMFL